MHRRLLPMAVGLLLAAGPAPVFAQSGGAVAPDDYGTSPRLRATTFTVSTGSVQLGRPLRFTWRVDGPVRRVRGRVALLPTTVGRAVSIALGTHRPGSRNVRTWTPRAALVPPGEYTARLHAAGPNGARLRRTAHASGRLTLQIRPPAPAPGAPPPGGVGSGLFPVQGPYDFGGPEARFGAGRIGHVHQGQDIMAAEGTPVVTPVAGAVYWRAYQAGGAGYYVVIRGDDGRDYAYMHFQDGSVLVTKGERVAAGQRLASVGATGDARGPHLHFEIWPDGWYANADSHPIDPLRDLLAWASAG